MGIFHRFSKKESEQIHKTLSNSSIKITNDIAPYTIDAQLKMDFQAKNTYSASAKLNYREQDEIRIDTNRFIYSFYDFVAKKLFVYGIKGEDIAQLTFSHHMNCLYVVADYKKMVFNNGELVEQSNFLSSDGFVLVIPLYFNSNNEIVDKIKKMSDVEMEFIN